MVFNTVIDACAGAYLKYSPRAGFAGVTAGAGVGGADGADLIAALL